MSDATTRPLALVTGPTSGIGRCFAHRLAERGYDLVLVARDRQRLEEVANSLQESHGTSVEVMVADLADRAQLAPIEARVRKGVDLLVNSAGHSMKHAFLNNDVEQEQEMLDVFVTAVMRLTHAALPAMIARGSGAVVNVSSVAGYLPRGTYSAAKAYVTSLSEWADLTYRRDGVRVMALLPGFTRTEFHQRMNVRTDSAPSWMWLDADRVVRDALADLDRGRRVSIPSKRYKLLSLGARYTPAPIQARFQGLGRN